MPKAPKLPQPIMSPDAESYMAFEGLVQWAHAVVRQSARVSEAQARMTSIGWGSTVTERRLAAFDLQSECHFFADAAQMLMQFKGFALARGLCTAIDFSPIDQFNSQDIQDLRNMREHVTDYFRGSGHYPQRWVSVSPDGSADASTIVMGKIGNRLDWVAFGAATETVLAELLNDPGPPAPT